MRSSSDAARMFFLDLLLNSSMKGGAGERVFTLTAIA